MTQNQIAFHNAKETEKHNRAYEAELERHQKADEAIRARANAIQAAMNAVNALHYERMDTETHRSNLAHEYLSAGTLAETSRHDRASEAITRSLNASLIKRNEAEASYASANTGYIQEMTRTQAEETKKRGYEAQAASIGVGTAAYERMKTMNQAKESSARATLLQEQAAIQWTYGFKNYTGGINDISHAVRNVVDTSGNLFSLLFGDQGVSTMQQQNMDMVNGASSGESDLDAYLNGSIDIGSFTNNPNYYQ